MPFLSRMQHCPLSVVASLCLLWLHLATNEAWQPLSQQPQQRRQPSLRTTAAISMRYASPYPQEPSVVLSQKKQEQQQHQPSPTESSSFISSSSSLTPLASSSSSSSTRRNVLQHLGWTAATTTLTILTIAPSFIFTSQPANALIKGNTPPPKKSSASMEKLKCTNIDECIALGEQQQQANVEKAEREAAIQSPPLTTPKGVKYRDLQPGTGTQVVQPGDQVTLAYKVLKLGKRSYDGLSGEGTVIFSRGYGLEDDEEQAGDKSWTTTVGQINNIIALDEALVGMKVHGIRRFTVMPQVGWERPTRACDGGPGGRGPGGDVKVDYVVVPSATMVATEACLDNTRQPFPTTYAQQRRMAQRFDQSLLMEVQVLGINDNTNTN